MIHNKTKVAAGVLTVVLALSGTELNAYAANMNSFLPAAGIGLSLEEGVSMKEVAEGKKTETAIKIVEPIKTEKATEEITTLEETITEAAEEETAAEETMAEEEVSTEETAEEQKEDFSNLVIAQVNDYVNVRSMASEEGEIVGKLYDNSVGTFLEEENGWYKIQSGNCTGYVKAEYCVTGEEANELAKEVGRRTATVTTVTLNVRKEANTDSSILGQVPIEEVLTVTEELDGWVKVKIEEGSGYVSTEFVTLGMEFVQAESKEEEDARLRKEEEARQAAIAASRKAQNNAAQSNEVQEEAADSAAQDSSTQEEAPVSIPVSDESLGQQVVDYALQFVGNPYVYGGTSLTNGADCSGFVMSVYANFGVSLPHSSSADRKVGYSAGGIGDAIPGDIVCYSGHVGIYAGNGQIVHASNSRQGIIVSDANYDTILAVRRIF